MSGRRRHLYGNFKVSLLSAQASCVLIFKLMWLLVPGNAMAWCPLNCSCLRETGLVQCHFLTLQGIPREVPHWVQNLSITGRNLTTLQASSFKNNGTQLSNLTTLLLTNNNVQTIRPLAFFQLPHLVTLDLSFNDLRSIAKDAFTGVAHLQVLRLNQAFREAEGTRLVDDQWLKNAKSLKALEVSGNGLQAFPAGLLKLDRLQVLNIRNNSIKLLDEATVSWLKHRNVWVYLSPNPLACDCKSREMIFWIRNTTQVLDSQSLRCFSPESLNGTQVLSVTPDALKCLNENLETASYVFFGIVLALIGLIFLMVLYLNRRGIKRWLNNFREACRDQMEGYHYRYEQDTDPRRSNAATGI